MSYKLVVSDLDGTLLTNDHRVGDYTRRVLRGLIDRGIELAIASGRHFRDMRALAKPFGDDVCTISDCRVIGAIDDEAVARHLETVFGDN